MSAQRQSEEAITFNQTDGREEEEEEHAADQNSGFNLRSFLWHGGSVYDAWFSCASNQVAQVLLTLPYSFSQLGMLSGIIFQVFYGIMGSWTAYLISILYVEYRSRKEKENVSFKNHVIQWFEVLDGLLGPYWKAIGLAFNCTFLLFGSVIQLIGCASNIYYINDHLDKRTWTYIFGACCATTVFIPSFHNYRIWSFLGLGMTTYTAWYMTIASIVHGQVEGVKHSGPDKLVLYFTGATNILYTFGGHAVTVEIMHAMWKPQKFKYVYLFATLYVFTLTLPSATAVYWAFGDQLLTHSNAFSLLPRNKWRDAGVTLMLIHQFITFGFACTPLYFVWEKVIGMHPGFCQFAYFRSSRKMEDDGQPSDGEAAASAAAKTSLFPVVPASQQITSVPQWLSNTSFTTQLSAINDAVAAHFKPEPPPSPPAPQEHEQGDVRSQAQPYEMLESSSGSDRSDERERTKKKKKSKRRKKRRRERSVERGSGAFADYGSRKSGVRVWADSETKPSKDYYLDSHGDRDNLAFGSLYRMDIARYKPYGLAELSRSDFRGLSRWNKTGSTLDRDADVEALDGKLKSAGRYWSAKYMALERHKNLKRARILVPRDLDATVSGDFIPLTDAQTSDDECVDGDDPLSRTSVVEESWEDEVLRKTREFNKLTREHPHDEKVWLDFAEFQDRVADMQPQKGARLQILEKKISILEKAAELNPDNEELLLPLLKAYQRRDNSDVLISRWEKILIQHSGSYRLWREFLRVIQGEFSRFKVSDMRKMYTHAIQALASACRKHIRQVCQAENHPPDAATVQLELGLVDIFLSFCRFEWQAGYQELATALFQAEIEFSLFCPSLLLTEQSKQILFEHFWNSDGARVGEEGALGWSTWLEKEEENRQRVIREETAHDDEGGWTGWSEPLAQNKENSIETEKESESNVVVEEFQEELEDEDVKQEEDTETLLKMLGIDVDVGASGEIKDSSTWIKWSEEELSRDCVQWMPVRTRAAVSHNVGTPDGETDDHLSRVIMYEDVNEYLFSLSSSEARLSLVLQFVDFFGGKSSQWISTNSSTWAEKVLSLEALPDSILQTLRKVHDFLIKTQGSSSNFSLESLLGTTNDIYRRTDMMKFLRNATLLCLSAFPRHFVLEDAALVAEELSALNLNPSSRSVTPCRALAKFLLKSDRQDVLLCGVYARREAFHGNIDHARRVFDMALSSIEGLPLELRSNASLLYFWYAETELANEHGNGCESSLRAMHILFCLGSGSTYSPYKSHPSNLQLLRARQGFKEKIRTVQMALMRGVIDDQSVALICSAALFEELTSGWAAGIEVLDQAFALVLPERKSRSYQLEFMFSFYMKMLWKHHGQSSLSKCWESILQGLQIYPCSPELFSDFIKVGHLYTTPNKLRWVFDDHCHKKPSVVVWLFALSFELSKGGSEHRIRGLFERALGDDRFHNSVVLWRCYIAYEMNMAKNPSAARRNFFRAIHACPWSKKLWLDGFMKLNSILSAKELSDLQEVMRDKELNLRTDIYEILLQDEFVS